MGRARGFLVAEWPTRSVAVFSFPEKAVRSALCALMCYGQTQGESCFPGISLGPVARAMMSLGPFNEDAQKCAGFEPRSGWSPFEGVSAGSVGP